MPCIIEIVSFYILAFLRAVFIPPELKLVLSIEFSRNNGEPSYSIDEILFCTLQLRSKLKYNSSGLSATERIKFLMVLTAFSFLVMYLIYHPRNKFLIAILEILQTTLFIPLSSISSIASCSSIKLGWPSSMKKACPPGKGIISVAILSNEGNPFGQITKAI